MNLKLKTFSFALMASASTGVYAQTHTENNSANDSEQPKKEERNVMLNAADANKPREIQIGLPSEDVTVYENGLPAVYSSSVHRLSAHWRSDASLKGTDLMTPSESAIRTGNIAYAARKVEVEVLHAEVVGLIVELSAELLFAQLAESRNGISDVTGTDGTL